ncbi:Clp protease ClpS [Blastopirellula marina]|uniref:Clp protease ClpS n=2 Tax=Blastopirellula marina TaxID=124 RepID=A0A2S8GCX6_9BACT|nr:Clp protease ClpS [Blastopirellula marina]
MNSDDTTLANPEAEFQTQLRRQPPYGVVLHNDDMNTFDYVVDTIRTVFRYELEKCFQLTLEADQTGRSILWSGTLEGAELKREQMISRGPDPKVRDRGALPLKVTLEEMPQ